MNMKKLSSSIFIVFVVIGFSCNNKVSQTSKPAEVAKTSHLFLDVHNLGPGKVTLADVAGAHQKDLATQKKYGTNFIKYWVDENAGKVYCLVESPDSAALSNTHKEAHGLVPDFVHMVSDGPEAAIHPNSTLFLDVHKLGAGNVNAEGVAKAHEKDLATQGKYGANFINYWLDEKQGLVMCLVEAKDSTQLINTHREAHGLIPDEIHKVQQGQ
jgi:hypothetical protein